VQIIRHPHDLPPIARGGAVAIGNFDGVHKGHARILQRLAQRADELKAHSVVFTFEPHPARVLRPEACPPPLTWTERKAELLAEQRIDWMLVYPTDLGLLSLAAYEFFDRVIVDLLAARALVEGPNFFFGKDREGTIDRLAQLAAAKGISLDIVEPLELEGGLVSSSRVRALVSQGDVAVARAMLTAPYRIRGLVTHGAGRGTQLGFPTANLEGVDTLMPAHGVYAGVAWRGHRHWPAALHLGPNPTFGEHVTKVEVHLIGAEEVLYGQILEVDFLSRLRGVVTFDSVDELAAQLRLDVAAAAMEAEQYFASQHSSAHQPGRIESATPVRERFET
jgi:riboflavin kinase / FMN adenylyltransferase